MYWNETYECMDPNDRKKLQLERLQALVQRAYEQVPFYRRTLEDCNVRPEDIKHLYPEINIEDMITTAVNRVPILEKADMLTAWTGIRPMTPDDHPILGPVEAVDGFILNCGWGGTGIIMAPIAGRLISDYLSRESTPIVDIDQLSLKRFKCP